MSELSKIEHEYHAKILLSVETGSRVWGMSCEKSDYDVRFIYARPIEWYLSLIPRRDVIGPIFVHELDIMGWDIKKALLLMQKGNTGFFEIITSPIVYSEYEDFLADMQRIVPRFFDQGSAFRHYVRLAESEYRKNLESGSASHKKYLFALRSLACAEWILSQKKMPPHHINEVTIGLPEVQEMTHLLLESRWAASEIPGELAKRMNLWIERALDYYKSQHVKAMVMPDLDEVDFLFRSILKSIE